MPKQVLESAERSGRRRFPWLTKGDMAILSALDAVDSRMADEFEHLIRQQAVADAAFHERVKLESGLWNTHQPIRNGNQLEHIHGVAAVRWSMGTGGGKHRRRIEEIVH